MTKLRWVEEKKKKKMLIFLLQSRNSALAVPSWSVGTNSQGQHGQSRAEKKAGWPNDISIRKCDFPGISTLPAPASREGVKHSLAQSLTKNTARRL